LYANAKRRQIFYKTRKIFTGTLNLFNYDRLHICFEVAIKKKSDLQTGNEKFYIHFTLETFLINNVEYKLAA